MDILRASDLIAKGINPETATVLSFRGKLLARGASFTPDHHQRAYQLCRLYEESGIFCLLVDQAGVLTLWCEQQEHRPVTRISPVGAITPNVPNAIPDPCPPPNPDLIPSPEPTPVPSTPTRSRTSQIYYRGRPVGGSSGNSAAIPLDPQSSSSAAPPPPRDRRSRPLKPPSQPLPPAPPHSLPTSSPAFSREGSIGRFLFRGQAVTASGGASVPSSRPPEENPTGASVGQMGPGGLDGSPQQQEEGSFQLSEDGRYLQANPALARIFGYASPQELMMGLSQIGLQIYVDVKMRLEMMRLLRQQDSVSQFELKVYRKDGSIAKIRETLTARRDPHGKLLYYQGLVSLVQDAPPGPLLGGRYRVLKPLGSGGFGQTFLAEDTHRPKNPLCVVKQLHSDSEDPHFLETARKLFNTEAETLERLGKHPQIPQLLAYFSEQQNFYLAQEYIEGHSLDRIFSKKRLTENQVVGMLNDLLGVLEFVHQQNVIHRDIKPSNIIRRKSDGRLVVLDFGAVKEIRTGLSGNTNSSLAISVGTQGYMPIEQYAGKPRFNSDLYAVGVVAIEALTGLSPEKLETDSHSGELKWQADPPVSEEFRAIVDKLVRYHFASRYQRTGDVLEDLGTLIKTRSGK